MEWQYLIVTPEQNTIENGYGPPDKAEEAAIAKGDDKSMMQCKQWPSSPSPAAHSSPF